MESKDQPDIKVTRSFGRNRLGVPVFFVRPLEASFNRSRRFVGYDKLNKGVERWFAPAVKMFLVDGHLIGSNSEKNALKEYHRVCTKEKIRRVFEVKLLITEDAKQSKDEKKPEVIIKQVSSWRITDKHPCPKCGKKLSQPDYICIDCNVKVKLVMQF